MNKVTIVIPVYADWPSLSDCLDSVIKHTDKSNSVIVINDVGPEADVMEKNIEDKIKGQSNFKYFRNSKNLGFIKTCNKAVQKLDKTKNDILLLNSDTKVTSGFLDELQKALQDNKAAVVSPRSNNATLCTVPLSAAPKKGIYANESYELFINKIKTNSKFPSSNVAPTAHGFCMLIKRSVIHKIGLFDEVFGKGYGEEVDFCQRARKVGYKCLISNRSFVFHLEARSFTIETKNKLLEKNNKIIWKRWPNYRDEVREYMKKQNEFEDKIFLAKFGKLKRKLKFFK